MDPASRRMAGILLILFPTVAWGGASLLRLLTTDPTYAANPLRQNLWRAGHAHAGVLLVLSLVSLQYVDEARLTGQSRSLVRHAIPLAAILLPATFFLSMLHREATEPSPLIYLPYVGAVVLVAGMLGLGVGLVRSVG